MTKIATRLVLLLCLALASCALAQGSYTASRSGLDAVDVDIMFIGAHPDDDGGVMGTFARYLRDGGYTGTVGDADRRRGRLERGGAGKRAGARADS